MPADCYRSAASVLVLRPTEVCSPDGCQTVYQILLLHKPRKNDAWQLPQGGVEAGETTEQAAARELMEEAGVQGQILGKSSEVYQYDFPPSYRRFRPDHICGQRIEYVFALTAPDAVVHEDKKEVDGHVWVDLSQLSQYIKRKEYLTLVERLYGEAATIVKHKQ